MAGRRRKMSAGKGAMLREARSKEFKGEMPPQIEKPAKKKMPPAAGMKKPMLPKSMPKMASSKTAAPKRKKKAG